MSTKKATLDSQEFSDTQESFDTKDDNKLPRLVDNLFSFLEKENKNNVFFANNKDRRQDIIDFIWFQLWPIINQKNYSFEDIFDCCYKYNDVPLKYSKKYNFDFFLLLSNNWIFDYWFLKDKKRSRYDDYYEREETWWKYIYKSNDDYLWELKGESKKVTKEFIKIIPRDLKHILEKKLPIYNETIKKWDIVYFTEMYITKSENNKKYKWKEFKVIKKIWDSSYKLEPLDSSVDLWVTSAFNEMYLSKKNDTKQ